MSISYSHTLGKLQDGAKQIKLSIRDKIQQEDFTITAFNWTTVAELKNKIFKLKGIQVNQQRLFIQHQEMVKNNQTLNSYAINSNTILTLSTYPQFKDRGYIKPYDEIQELPLKMKQTIYQIEKGFKIGLKPRLTDQGTSGTYFLQGINRKNMAIFKPFDEEPFAPNNPRDITGRFDTPGFRKGIRSGESAVREVIAYMLDSSHYHGVPPTTFVELSNEVFSKTQNSFIGGGSFINSGSFVQDFDGKQHQKLSIIQFQLQFLMILNIFVIIFKYKRNLKFFKSTCQLFVLYFF